MDRSKTGNYAEPELRNCLIPSTYMHEEITPLQSQPALATKWTFGQLLTTVQTSLLHPLLASGRLALGGSSVPHNPPTFAGELPLWERFQVLTSLGSSTQTQPSQGGSPGRNWYLTWTSWPEARGSSYCARGPTSLSVLNQSRITPQGMLKVFLALSSCTYWLPSNCSLSQTPRESVL